MKHGMILALFLSLLLFSSCRLAPPSLALTGSEEVQVYDSVTLVAKAPLKDLNKETREAVDQLLELLRHGSATLSYVSYAPGQLLIHSEAWSVNCQEGQIIINERDRAQGVRDVQDNERALLEKIVEGVRQ